MFTFREGTPLTNRKRENEKERTNECYLTHSAFLLHERACNLDIYRPIKVTWPEELEGIDFGNSFGQPVERMMLPAGMVYLDFGDLFDHPVEGLNWPAGVFALSFGREFDHPVADTVWPTALTEVGVRPIFKSCRWKEDVRGDSSEPEHSYLSSRQRIVLVR